MDERLPSVSWFLSCGGRLCPSDAPTDANARVRHRQQANTGQQHAQISCDSESRGGQRRDIDYRAEDVRPAASYRELITEAIAAIEPRKGDKVLLADIYSYLKENYAFFRNSDSSWKNSIRHNLAQNKFFMKVPREENDTGSGRGAYWIMNKTLDDRENIRGMLKRRPSEERRANERRQRPHSASRRPGAECESAAGGGVKCRRMPDAMGKRRDSPPADINEQEVQPQRKRKRAELLSIKELPTIVLSPAETNSLASTPISPFSPCTLNKLSLSDHVANDRNKRATPPLLRCSMDDEAFALTTLSPPLSSDDFHPYRNFECMWGPDLRTSPYDHGLLSPVRQLQDDVFELSRLDSSSPQPDHHPWHDEAMLANDDVFLPS